MRFKAGGTLDYVYDNEKCAFDDQDSLFPVGNTLTARRKFIVAEKLLTRKLTALQHLNLLGI